MGNIIVVGSEGQCSCRLIGPALDSLQDDGQANVLATCDITKRTENGYGSNDTPHVVRKEGEKLSETLKDYKSGEPIVFLANPNDFHTPDSIDLIENGFKVIVEKPYCVPGDIRNPKIDPLEELNTFNAAIKEESDKIFPIDHYMASRVSQILSLTGALKQDSYMFNHGIPRFEETLEDLVGTPSSVQFDLLEGKGEVGDLGDRGIHLYDIRVGGGMIQDLLIHASFLFHMQDYIGGIDSDFADGSIKTARCNQYIEAANKKFEDAPIPDEYLGESYTEMNLETDNGVDVQLRLGKYILGRNQKRVVVRGDRGVIYSDLDTKTVSLFKPDFRDDGEDKAIKVINEWKNTPQSYHLVYEAAMQHFSGKGGFNYMTPTESSLRAQRLTLNALDKACKNNTDVRYNKGADPKDIFQE